MGVGLGGTQLTSGTESLYMVILRAPVIFPAISQRTSRVINYEVPVRKGLVSSNSLQPQGRGDRRLRGKLLPSPATDILKSPDALTLALTKAET